MIEAAARIHGLPLEFFGRVIWQERRFLLVKPAHLRSRLPLHFGREMPILRA
jgi:hypothetical protein